LAPHVGVNFWPIKHTFNIKTDLGYRVLTSNADAPKPPAVRDLFWTTQGQVFF